MQKKSNRRRVWRAIACALPALALACALTACGGSAPAGSAGSAEVSSAEQTVSFTDSAGREVRVPKKIERIVPSGHTATQVLLTVAPEKMVGLSQKLTPDQQRYFGDRIPKDLPVLGAAFGAKGDLNKEAVASTGAQVLIDTGQYKDGMKEDLDALQEQLGIPVVFIEAKLDEWPAAYKKLGELLGVEKRADKLASYCEKAYDEVEDIMKTIPEDQRTRVLYCVGDSGTNVLAKGSFQANVVDMLAQNVAVVDSPAGTGAGNESNLEQIAAWNPDVILFAPDSIYDTVASDPAWASVPAIKDGRFYRVPGSPYNWLHNPPTVNQVLGLQWLARVLYPEQFDGLGSTYDVARDYYKTFYGHDLSQQEYDDMVA